MMVKAGRYDRMLEKVVILSAGNGSLSATMKVEKEHTNLGGSLHGGLASSLTDSLTTLAMMTYPGISSAGVSVALNLSYLSVALEGQDILMKATTDKVGKRLAYLSMDILSKASGSIVAKGTHTKYIGG
jgi:acyl-coenzyme A thioesterase 13